MNDGYTIPEGHSDPEVLLVGNIDFEDVFNEQEIGRINTKSIGECKVEIYPNEGSIPHMHIYNKDKSFDTCVCIYSNNYFSHGGKNKSKFTSKQCKEFNKWMTELNNNFDPPTTNWQAIKSLWNIMNPDCKFPGSRKVKTQPHYEDMINFKDQ